MKNVFDVVIVGAGLGGVALARELKSQNVLLLDKAKSPGGRAATRRVGGIPVNHGLDQFQGSHSLLEELTSLGLKENLLLKEKNFFRPISGINSWVKLLAQDLQFENLKTVKFIEQQEGISTIWDDEGNMIAQSSIVVLATPAMQAYEILRKSGYASAFLKEVEYTALIRHYVLLKESLAHRDLILLKETTSGFLYSYDVSGDLPDNLRLMPRDELNSYFLKTFAIPSELIIDSYSHRWLYSQVKKSISQDFQFAFADRNLFLLGDYFSVNGVEGVMNAVYRLKKNLFLNSV